MMANLCALHNPPLDPHAEFSVAAAAPAVPLDLAQTRRLKIWELSGSLHCSIVGTCLSAPELRRLFARLGDDDARTADDHGLHGRAVRAASRREDGGKLLNKALDKRHEGAIRRFAKARTASEVRALWTRALDDGDIAGSYWALLTHPATDDGLFKRAFGEVHMLSHQVGAAARLDIARLRRLEAEVAERDEKIARQQARLAAAAAERAAHRETIERLEARLARLESAAPRRSADVDGGEIDALRRELAGESARATSLAQKLSASEHGRARAEAERRDAIASADAAQREIFALEAAFGTLDAPEGAEPSGQALRGVKILYVGGRPGSIDRIGEFVAGRGGALIAHDGGVEDNLALLPGLVSQADVVYFPVDCISHSAADKVKKLCQRLAKSWAPLRSASLAGFVAKITAADDLHQRRFVAAAE